MRARVGVDLVRRGVTFVCGVGVLRWLDAREARTGVGPLSADGRNRLLRLDVDMIDEVSNGKVPKSAITELNLR